MIPLAALGLSAGEEHRETCLCDRCIGRYGSPSRAALRHALENVYAGDQSVETDAVLDQLDALGYRLVLR